MKIKLITKFNIWCWSRYKESIAQKTIKDIYDKTIINIKLNNEKLTAFYLRSEARQGCSFSSILFSIVLKTPVTARRQGKKIKEIKIEKETVLTKLSLPDLEKEMAAHSSVLAWRIPWTEEPAGIQSMGSQRVRCDWVHARACARARTHTYTPLLEDSWYSM